MPRASKSGVRGLTRQPDGKWSIDLRWTDAKTGEVKRHHERLPDDVSAKAAKKRAVELLNQAHDGTLEQIHSAKGKPVRLHAALDDYMKWVETNRPRTLASRRSLTRILKSGLGDIPLRELVPFAVERYKRDRTAGKVELLDEAGERVNRKATVGPATVNREVAQLKHFVKLASEWGWLSLERSQSVRSMKMLKEPPGRVRYLSPDEETKLIGALPSGVREIVLAADLTGMRRAEVVGLKRSSVDLANGVITLTHTKSNRVRRIPIPSVLGPILDAALAHGKGKGADGADSEHVFLSPEGKPYRPDRVTRAFHRSVGDAGIENLRFHDVRHDFATKVRRRGAGLDVIATLLGHAQVTTTARYAHVEQELLRAAVAGLQLPTFSPTYAPTAPALNGKTRTARRVRGRMKTVS